jgi:hypothetical protein
LKDLRSLELADCEHQLALQVLPFADLMAFAASARLHRVIGGGRTALPQEEPICKRKPPAFALEAPGNSHTVSLPERRPCARLYPIHAAHSAECAKQAAQEAAMGEDANRVDRVNLFASVEKSV